MADQFLGEIRSFPFNFAPLGWAQCNGQLLAITSNTALFSILGTTYGGDGTTTFALPNLQGSTAAGVGTGTGLDELDLGEVDALVEDRAQAVPTAVTVARDMLSSVNTTQVAAVLPPEPTLVVNYCIALEGIFPPRP
jgi:microcystin-dependent protein